MILLIKYPVKEAEEIVSKPNHITVICGHYGCGKTNLALNLALEAADRGEKTSLIDMDIVNPYFRSSEYGPLLEEHGIRLIAPVFAGTTLDTPTLPPEIYSAFVSGGVHVFLDAGGDDAGITALGGLHEEISKCTYEMLYVVNHYRVLSRKAEEAVGLLREIERASRLKATAIVNNSHLGVETTLETVLASLPFAEEVAGLTGLPLLYSTVPEFALPKGEVPEGLKPVRRYVTFGWE